MQPISEETTPKECVRVTVIDQPTVASKGVKCVVCITSNVQCQ